MFCFSVTQLLLLRLNDEKKATLCPCLQYINPTLDSKSSYVQNRVVRYFLSHMDDEDETPVLIGNFCFDFLQKLPLNIIPDLQLKPGVLVFLNDSNLWLGAKKSACNPLLTTNVDPHIQIDLGELLSMVTEGKTLVQCNLYGSRPPDYDTFWKMYEKLGAKVFTFPRSRYTGGEKQVDTQIATDMIDSAKEHCFSPFKTILAIGTGDLDLLPPTRRVLQQDKHLKLKFGLGDGHYPV